MMPATRWSTAVPVLLLVGAATGRAQSLPNFGASDLTGVGQPALAPGAKLNLSWELQNTGAAVNTPVTYGYYLSRGPVPTAADFPLFTRTLGNVPAGYVGRQSDEGVTIPADFPPGVFSLAVIVDPLNTYVETSKQDNVAIAGNSLTIICPGNPAVNASSYDSGVLPPGYSGIFYEGILTPLCGDGIYSFALSAGGALPAGLALDPSTGIISGVPGAPGTSIFVVDVTDGRGLVGRGDFSITINPYVAGLAIVTDAIPAATFGGSYSVGISVVGGAPPYQWCGPAAPCPWALGLPSPVQGELPPGILLSADGVLSGVPAAGGSYPFQVLVRDSAGATQTSNFYTMTITAPGHVIVATGSLPKAFLGQSYNAKLAAAGGQTPYAHNPLTEPGSAAGWLVLDTKRLPSSANDPGADLGAMVPPGLTLDLGGRLSGTPTEAGNFTLLVQVTDSSNPPQVATDVLLFTVLPANGLQILNTAPPQATLRVPYSLQLQTNAADPKSIVFIPMDASGHDSPNARASLPPGITLNQAGLLSGVPSAMGSFPFLVQATDGQGRIVIQALEVTVVQPLLSGGCSTPSGEASQTPAILALALLGLGLRKRSGPSTTSI
jgi:hypothetical protein